MAERIFSRLKMIYAATLAACSLEVKPETIRGKCGTFDPYTRGYKPIAMRRCCARAQISRLTGEDRCEP